MSSFETEPNVNVKFAYLEIISSVSVNFEMIKFLKNLGLVSWLTLQLSSKFHQDAIFDQIKTILKQIKSK